MSPEYKAILEKFRAAGKTFRKVQEAYRAKECDDNTFLAAREAYLAVSAEFDIIEAKEF